jgi:hypothetical protein
MTGDDTTYGAAIVFLALCGIAAFLIWLACVIADAHQRGLARLRRAQWLDIYRAHQAHPAVRAHRAATRQRLENRR